MKAYVLKGIGQLDYDDVPMPGLHSGWALVEVRAAGVCGSDIPRIFTTGTYHFPTIPGHEFAGEVVDVFDAQDREWIGKRVGVFPLIPCRHCPACMEKRYEMCDNYDYLGSRRDGGFAEYAAVPVWNLIELPDNIDIKEAAMLEPASVALHAVRRLKLQKDDAAVLYGLGTIGLLIVQWLHILGIKNVFAVGHDPGHGAMLKEISKDDRYINADRNQSGENLKQKEDVSDWILEGTEGKGAAIAIDCVGTSESIKNCLNSVEMGGQILVVGNPKGDVFIDKDTYWKILRRQIRLTGTWNSSFFHVAEDDWHTVLRACSEEKLMLLDLITHCLAFDQLYRGLDIAKNHDEYHNKIMICRNRE